MKKIALSLLIATNCFATQPGDWSPAKERLWQRAHRARLQSISVQTIRDFPEYFSPRARMILSSYIYAVHDIPKILDLSILQSYGYNHPQPIYERLSRLHGKNPLSDDEKDELNSIKSELERIESIFRQQFFDVHGVAAELQEEILKAEKWFDHSDTRIARRGEVEIWGPSSLFEYFTEVLNDPMGAQIGQQIETYHSQYTRHISICETQITLH